MLNIFIRSSTTKSAIKTGKNLSNKIGKAYVQKVVSRDRRATAITKRMDRKWESPTEDCGNNQTNSTANGEKQFKLLSYNILAQDLLTEHIDIYWGIDTEWLKWEHRLRRLTEEITYINPDILCIQEMQYSHLKILVKHIKGNRKMEYVFKKKTGHRTDGCAIIFDKDKFVLMEDKGIEYYIPDINTLNRENIALMAKFNLREEPSKQVVVATTHLLYNPRRHDVRMAQVDVLLRALTNFASDAKRNINLPIILTGDFNSEPYSAPYIQLVKQVQSNHTAQATTSKTVNSISNENTSLQMLPIDFGYECASTQQGPWILVDYIMYSLAKNRENVKICSIYKLPTVLDCRDLGRIPNKYLGSDHFSLGITFALI